MASTRRSGIGPIAAILLMLVVILVPIVGHIILTIIILGDDLSFGEKILWLLVVWLLPFLGHWPCWLQCWGFVRLREV